MVIDVSYRNVWKAMKDIMTVEPRTNLVISTVDVSDRALSFRDPSSSGYGNNLRRF